MPAYGFMSVCLSIHLMLTFLVNFWVALYPCTNESRMFNSCLYKGFLQLGFLHLWCTLYLFSDHFVKLYGWMCITFQMPLVLQYVMLYPFTKAVFLKSIYVALLDQYLLSPPQQCWRRYINAAIYVWLAEWVCVCPCLSHFFFMGSIKTSIFFPITFKFII